jgi:uncharacterized coiled-coil protein SlyX
MEALLEQILAELKELNRQVAATNQAGQKQMREVDAVVKNMVASLPAGLMKGAQNVG